MTKIHSQDEPLRPDPSKIAHHEDSDQTFALPPDDPARVENRGGLEVTIGADDVNINDDDGNADDGDTRSEYSSG